MAEEIINQHNTAYIPLTKHRRQMIRLAVIAGAVLLGERMSVRELLGCIVMFAAIVLVQLRGE